MSGIRAVVLSVEIVPPLRRKLDIDCKNGPFWKEKNVLLEYIETIA